MVGLIQKSGFIKPGKAAGYIEYIATRDGVEKVGPDGYLEYMAMRPGSQGLFSSQPVVSLDAVMKEAERHTGPVWTLIYSLHREDAARLGYDNAESWRKLIKAHQVELATAMKIPPEQFRWYAAYHDADTHPHIHMTVWSDNPKLGFLTPEGIMTMRSVLTNSIFQDELYSLYQQKDISYKDLTAQARSSMRELVQQMESSLCDSPVIETQMLQLARELKKVSGRKVYGYLKKPLKEQVDAVVDELAKVPAVTECYEVWNTLRDELEGYYKDKPRQHLPLSQQKEFKAIKNMVIREAENLQLGVITFEDEGMQDEAPDNSRFSDPDIPNEDKRSVMEILERRWEDDGSAATAYQLGRIWRDGLGVPPDDEKRSCGFNVPLMVDTSVRSMRWQSFCMSRKEPEKRYSGMSRPQRTGIRLPATNSASPISPAMMFQRIPPKRWNTSPMPPNRGIPRRSTSWANCICWAMGWSRTGKRLSTG